MSRYAGQSVWVARLTGIDSLAGQTAWADHHRQIVFCIAGQRELDQPLAVHIVVKVLD